MSAKSRIAKAEQLVKKPPKDTVRLFWTLLDGTYQDVQTGRILTAAELEREDKTIGLQWRTGGNELQAG